MARTAAAAGARALIAVDAPIDAFNPNAIRASTGAVFSLPTVSLPLNELLAWTQENRVRLFAAMLTADARPCTEVDFTGSAAVVIGAEDEGLDAAWSDMAYRSGGCPVVIPMLTDRVDSLNASVAAGIILFEACRQRSRKKNPGDGRRG
jgi:TrmH family RNA methyltransferase